MPIAELSIIIIMQLFPLFCQVSLLNFF